MSRPTQNAGRRERLSLESGLEALQASPEFRGPVESLDGHDSNDHFALIYESKREQFAVAAPFIRHGLERGERCMYVVDERYRDDVTQAMRDAGIDVDAALESGALTFHTIQETYLRNGTFDPDQMIDFYADAIEAATKEYEALRVAAETSWILADDTTIAKFMEYESKVNDLFHDEDCIALCQYDRNAVPADLLCDIIRTHPHLIYDETVCQNFYYTPPEEFFGFEQPAREVDRMMNTLLERTEAKTTLQKRQQHLREQNEIVADPARSFEEKLQALFDLGCEQFDLELGAMAKVDPATDLFEVEYVSGDHEHFEPGLELPLSETYCTAATDSGGAASVADPIDAGYDDIRVYREFGIRAYLGTYVEVEGDRNRTFFFVSSAPRDRDFSEEERAFQRLIGQWVKYELERRQREDRLAALNTLAGELMNVETAAGVSEYIVEAAEETLDLPVTAIALYDDREGVLRPTARTSAADLLDVSSLLEIGDTVGWEAFVENDARRVDDPIEGTDASIRHPVTEVAVFPLGEHGVLVTGSTATGGFSATKLDFVETVAANTNAALDRADREQQLQERESILQEKNRTLERLTRVNDIIRNIDQALVQAFSRAEINEVVCEQLAESGPYELAWVGEHDAVTQEITPTEWAGSEKGFLDETAVTTDGEPESRGPTAQAVETGEPQVVNNILEDARYDPRRQAALNRGYHATIALPLRYDGFLYGVLNVYAGQPGVFGELERAVLTEMADTIAYAINAVESKKALVSSEIVELEFDVTDPNFELIELARETGCEITLESLVPRADGNFRVFSSTRGAPADDVLEFVPALPVNDVALIAEHDEGDEPVCLFEFTLDGESLSETVIEHGGRPHEITVNDGAATVVVHLAADADVREFVGMFQSNYPDSELVAQRSREQPTRTYTGFLATLTDELTARQLEALQTAYFSGYFEQPRTRTASEIADTMDIAQPTFNSHLRNAQRKLCQQLFEDYSVSA